ncbi:Annexin [Teladorsagia circumcincta]|uniref:Annexin n=1 Tax=Teladorsagia circumcincta TaxID=45464 RepID=A0A2G9UXH6_TELCI|nr:Annexin [Teladorsagia circumcincta]
MLREPYKIKYGKDIMTALDKKFSGDLEKTVFALMETPLEYDLKQLKQAMKGLGTDENTLIEILCSRTTDQIKAIRVAYEREFKKPLEQEVASETSGEFRDLLVAIVTGSRDPTSNTNDQMAKDIFAAFAELSGSSIEKLIEKEFSGDLKNSYLTIVRAASDKQKFFATQLYNSMKGLGTKDNDLIRVLVTRSEVDLQLIKEEFLALYNKSLEEMIRGDTSGAYRDALLAIVIGNRT